MANNRFGTAEQVSMLRNDEEISLRRFIENYPRLFSSQQDDFEILQLIKKDRKIQFDLNHLQNSESLDPFMLEYDRKILERFYILRQPHSWDCFLVTQETVQRILNFHKPFPPLLDLFCAFGFKTREDENSWGYFRQRSAADFSEYEICYSIRYMEKNGRKTGDPWSLRQTGVYQQTTVQVEESTWILLQPSARVRERLERITEAVAERNASPLDPFIIHVLILSSSLRNWNEYITSLYYDVDRLNEKACFSRVGFKREHDFMLTFSDCQKLRLIEQKTLRASSALDSYVDTGTCCASLCRLRGGFHGHSPTCAICIELASCVAEAESYRRKIANLLQHSSSTAILLLKILEYRNDEAIQESGKAERMTLEVMKDVAIQTKRENEGLAELAAQTQKDSKALKALTVIATMYLPATFLATLFSSNLIQLRPNGSNAESDTHFVLVDGFWKYAVIIIPLMAFTFGLTAFLEWIWSKTSSIGAGMRSV